MLSAETLRVAGIVGESIVDGPGFRLAVFAQGCPHGCAGCHNPQTWDPGGGTLVPIEQIIQKLDNPMLAGLTLSGGEPFAQPEPCAAIARAAIARGLTVWTYTGYTLEEIIAQGDASWFDLLSVTDTLVDGPYVAALRTLDLPFRGSSNQRLVEVKRALENLGAGTS